MYLFFDTETTGLPRDWKAPVSDLDNWPRLVQIAWILYDNSARLICDYDCIIKPEGFVIPRMASEIHGITTEMALEEGVSLAGVLNDFADVVKRARLLIAHNMSFDEKIVGAELLRMNMSNCLVGPAKLCTMTASTGYCKLPSPYGYKWPTLGELHYKLFESGFNDEHNAVKDVAACAKCFFELKKRGALLENDAFQYKMFG